MPVSSAFAESNRSQTERMRRLVASLDQASLTTKLPNGWTVAGGSHRGHHLDEIDAALAAAR